MLLTGLEDVEREAAAVGADAYLRKPFRPLELLSVVERVAAGQAGISLPARPRRHRTTSSCSSTPATSAT